MKLLKNIKKSISGSRYNITLHARKEMSPVQKKIIYLRKN